MRAHSSCCREARVRAHSCVCDLGHGDRARGRADSRSRVCADQILLRELGGGAARPRGRSAFRAAHEPARAPARLGSLERDLAGAFGGACRRRGQALLRASRGRLVRARIRGLGQRLAHAGRQAAARRLDLDHAARGIARSGACARAADRARSARNGTRRARAGAGDELEQARNPRGLREPRAVPWRAQGPRCRGTRALRQGAVRRRCARSRGAGRAPSRAERARGNGCAARLRDRRAGASGIVPVAELRRSARDRDGHAGDALSPSAAMEPRASSRSAAVAQPR